MVENRAANLTDLLSELQKYAGVDARTEAHQLFLTGLLSST